MSIFETHKGRHPWPQRTICEVQRQIYDLWVLKRYNEMLPLMEEAYVMGIKLVKKLVDYKVELPEWKQNTEEANKLRKLRVQLMEQLNEISDCL